MPVETLRARFAEAELPMRYYNPGLHRGAFALPTYVQELVDRRDRSVL
jgi:spermidine synthase